MTSGKIGTVKFWCRSLGKIPQDWRKFLFGDVLLPPRTPTGGEQLLSSSPKFNALQRFHSPQTICLKVHCPCVRCQNYYACQISLFPIVCVNKKFCLSSYTTGAELSSFSGFGFGKDDLEESGKGSYHSELKATKHSLANEEHAASLGIVGALTLADHPATQGRQAHAQQQPESPHEHLQQAIEPLQPRDLCMQKLKCAAFSASFFAVRCI